MDKQDELARVIMQAQLPKAKWDELTPTLQRYFRGAAAAVRSFMGSPEVMSRVHNAVEGAMPCGAEGDAATIDHIADAALSAAIDGDIGGGRG